MLAAHIAVIPKEGKDSSAVANYRRISLLNVDIKIYAKVLANRLLPLVPDLISLDQVGFVPGREARDNTIRTLNLHHWLTSSKSQGFFLSLDTEKAFYRVAWDYMQEVLAAVGLGTRMLSYIMALYTNPSAAVKVNGHLSSAFPISNGTRQGCPLSPLIYILTLEPFLNRLRENSNIQGVTVKNREFKVAAFAGDILLSLQSPHISLPNLLKDIEHFSNLSNLKINYAKSQALNVFLPSQAVALCQTSFPFRWEQDTFTYLGIRIPTRLSDLYLKNFHPALLQIKKNLKDWHSLNISWFGRSALVYSISCNQFPFLYQQTFLNPIGEPAPLSCGGILRPVLNLPDLHYPNSEGE